MKFMWKHIRTRVWMIVTSVLLVLALVISLVITQVPLISSALNLYLGGSQAKIGSDARAETYDQQYTTKDEVYAAANQFVVEVEKEGITMLKNENNALPLKQNAKVSVFGKNSVNLVTSGSGSAGNSSTAAKTIYQSLGDAGIVYNDALYSFYNDSSRSGTGRPKNPDMESGKRLSGFATGETAINKLKSDSAVQNSYSSFPDAALVVISRIGGEGFDLPRTMATSFDSGAAAVEGAESATSHYLELDKNEKGMIEEAKAHYSKVIVILNVGTTIELGDLKNDSGISAILWVGLPGVEGIMALGQVLNGNVTPSGHTVDTWAADFTQDPTWYNTGTYGSEYGNRYIYDGSESKFAFVNYEEGIYVGYRYYETRGAQDSNWYSSSVVYPFGYGLSYTTFDWQVNFKKASGSKITESDKIEVEVTVTNTGSYAGKDVVELYYTAPYTAGGIEKSEVVLGAFAKTPMLYPSSQANGSDKPNSAKVTLELDVSDMKSYDYADANNNNFKGYELEKGNYKISISSDAHTAKATATYTLDNDVTLRTDTDRNGNTVDIVNQFDDVSAGIFGTTTYADYTTRADFAGTVASSYIKDADRTLTAELYNALDASTKRKYNGTDSGQPWEVKGTSPSTTAVNNNISLKDMLYDESGQYVGSVDYNDSRWNDLLDEIPLSEMKSLIGAGAFTTIAVSGVDGIVAKPVTNDEDGPCGFTNFVSGSVVYGTCSYMAECVMGSTWNIDLAYQMGVMVGEEGLIGNADGDGLPYSGWYAPAINIHRSQFAGRNWEYYSEDSLLSGKLAANVVKGAMSKGVYTYVKHFAVNDQETDREYNGILVWANEQSMREIYLRAFEITVKEGGTTAMMSSFNRLGTTWAGGSYALLTSVLRNEWGFQGMVITDWSTNNYTHIDEMIRAGGDLFLAMDPKSFGMTDDATQVTLLRQATKNILYTVANSNVMSLNVSGYSLPMWQIVMIVIDVGIVVLCAAWGVWAILSAKKKDKKAE